MKAAVSRLQALLCNHRCWRRWKRRCWSERSVLGYSACLCMLLCSGGIWMSPPARSPAKVWLSLCSSGTAPDWGDQCPKAFWVYVDPTAQPGLLDLQSWIPDWSQSSGSDGSRWRQRGGGRGRTATDAVKLLHYHLIKNKDGRKDDRYNNIMKQVLLLISLIIIIR